MTTLITYGDSDTTRRCDGKCHNAKGPKCECICGGRNHGVGYEQAIRNVTADMEAILNAEGFKLSEFQYPLPLGEALSIDVIQPTAKTVQEPAWSLK